MVLSLGVVGIAVASAPVVTINTVGSQEFAVFPQTISVTGTIDHVDDVDGPNDNVCAVHAMKVIVNDGLIDTTILDQGNPSDFFGWTCDQTVGNWNTDWSILAPGTYTVTASAKHQSAAGEDEEVVEVTEVVIDECPAAPAIAGAFMKSGNSDKGIIKEGSSVWKKVMKLVADQTGSKGTLWAANACEEGYEAAVKVFVNVNN